MENIAKSTSYGCYLDCDFETAKYPDDKTHIVGLLAEYVYDLEQRILHYDERYIKLWNEIETLRECVSKEFDQEQKIADLEAKLAESEKSKESYRLQNEHHHLQLLQFYSRLGVEAFGADIHEKALETLMIMKEQLAEKDKAIEKWQTMYGSVVQTCHNDKEEIEMLNKKLETQENTITNIVEDNRASQEWYKKQLEEKEKERHEEWKTGKEWKWEWQKVNQELEKAEQDKISFAVYELSLVNGMLTDAIIEITQNETDANKLYYLEKIAKKFAEKTGGRINELKEMK